MTTYAKPVPPDSPTYLCTSCAREICDDCASIGGEYEFLANQRASLLFRAEDEIKELKRQVEDLQRSVELLKHAAGVGYPEVIVAWMETTMEKKHTRITK